MQYRTCLPCDNVVKVCAERGDFNAGRQCQRCKLFFFSRHRTEMSLADYFFSELLFSVAKQNIGVSHAESLVIKYFTSSA